VLYTLVMVMMMMVVVVVMLFFGVECVLCAVLCCAVSAG
jgi:hypothetical protein